MNKKILLTLASIAIIGGGILATSSYADNEGSRGSFIERLAERFNLNQDEVKNFLEENREDHKEKMTEAMDDRLSQLVADGEITEAQKQVISEKHEELKSQKEANHDSLKDLTREDRRARMEEMREELKIWAEENGIDIEYLKFGKGHKTGSKLMFRHK